MYESQWCGDRCQRPSPLASTLGRKTSVKASKEGATHLAFGRRGRLPFSTGTTSAGWGLRSVTLAPKSNATFCLPMFRTNRLCGSGEAGSGTTELFFMTVTLPLIAAKKWAALNFWVILELGRLAGFTARRIAAFIRWNSL